MRYFINDVQVPMDQWQARVDALDLNKDAKGTRSIVLPPGWRLRVSLATNEARLEEVRP